MFITEYLYRYLLLKLFMIASNTCIFVNPFVRLPICFAGSTYKYVFLAKEKSQHPRIICFSVFVGGNWCKAADMAETFIIFYILHL